ncbi:hypothetical protein FQZ97_1087240 [compost metagenome]
MYLIPLSVILLAGYALVTGRRIGIPDKWNDRILDGLDRLRRRVFGTYNRLLGRFRGDAGGRA